MVKFLILMVISAAGADLAFDDAQILRQIVARCAGVVTSTENFGSGLMRSPDP